MSTEVQPPGELTVLITVMIVCRPPAYVSKLPTDGFDHGHDTLSTPSRCVKTSVCDCRIRQLDAEGSAKHFGMPFVVGRRFSRGKLAVSGRSSRTAGKVRRVQNNDAVAVPVKFKLFKLCSLVEFGNI